MNCTQAWTLGSIPLVIGVTAWNNGLVARLQALVSQMQAVR